MATLKVVLRTSKIDAAGNAPLYVRVTKHRKSTFVSLGYKVTPDAWDDEKGKVKQNHPNHRELNLLIADRLLELQRETVVAETASASVSVPAIKAVVKGSSATDFFRFADEYLASIAAQNRVGTLHAYGNGVRTLKRFRPALSFSELTPSFLRQYETFLVQLGLKDTTRAKRLSILRTLLFQAIKEGRFPVEKNPFFQYRVKSAKGEKQKLSMAEIKRIEMLDYPKLRPLWWAQRAFLFGFYSAGMRVSDILKLKWENHSDGRILYQMTKTGIRKDLPIVPPLGKLLSEIRATANPEYAYVFPWLNWFAVEKATPVQLNKKLSSLTAQLNKQLKRIAADASIHIPLTTHIARHSFADFARTSGMGLYEISKALGHSSLKITENYLKSFDREAVDSEMHRIFQETESADA